MRARVRGPARTRGHGALRIDAVQRMCTLAQRFAPATHCMQLRTADGCSGRRCACAGQSSRACLRCLLVRTAAPPMHPTAAHPDLRPRLQPTASPFIPLCVCTYLCVCVQDMHGFITSETLLENALETGQARMAVRWAHSHSHSHSHGGGGRGGRGFPGPPTFVVITIYVPSRGAARRPAGTVGGARRPRPRAAYPALHTWATPAARCRRLRECTSAAACPAWQLPRARPPSQHGNCLTASHGLPMDGCPWTALQVMKVADMRRYLRLYKTGADVAILYKSEGRSPASVMVLPLVAPDAARIGCLYIVSR